MTISIAIEAEDWMLSAGLIGLTRLFEEDRDRVLTHSGIVLSEEHILQFPKRYIYWMIQNFSIVQRDRRRMEWWINQADRAQSRAQSEPNQAAEMDAKVREAAKEIRKMMTEQAKKVEKYFGDLPEYSKLLEIIESLNSINKHDEVSKIHENVDLYETVMSTPVINEKLTLNYVKALIMGPFFGQTSILQPTFNAKSTEQHIDQLDKDFAVPALRELQLYGELSNSPDQSNILALLQEHSETYKPFKDWLKTAKKINSPEEIHHFFKQQLLPCSFIDGLPATQSFEEMTFSPLALSKKNAVNFNWNFNKGLPVPISAVARLILLAVPIGLTVYNRRLGTEQFNEHKRFFGMVLSQKSFIEVVKDNERYRTLRSREGSTFGEAIVGLLNESIDKAARVKEPAYLFVELHSEYQAKKTLLDYYHMPLYLAAFLKKYGETLESIHHHHLREAFLRSVLKGLDPKASVYELLRISVDPKLNMNEKARIASSAYQAARTRKRILQAKKGEKEMTSYDKKIYHVYSEGVTLRKRLISTRPTEEVEGEEYRATGRKKLEGWAYRLLNSAKSNNKAEFMDTVFRLYLTANTSGARQNGRYGSVGVSSIFLDGFKQEDGLDFDSIATAFIAGLLGQDSPSSQSTEEVAINE
ncbi:MAG: type I-B CRISPR-associated protein Cas8b1/Cst1 [Paenibacillus macerans]|uniref:type I-B CRISPR-associated protein Cas8b1/Cst1 n=1 Tax=Paenibacillus TaxID=44249 RepID=UPI00242D7C73|nr:type I-B CRISPR-associated protein Cas8b1/Cst1 [Paenibacillus macerans]MBS5909962.1 type I-B CRISPR-associated protein Cas8b1/Cst1 [Paenibacillus macerans]MDU7476068.1 type I-B CRISPR-associated protein Cas8b1/Cst1 [Paenibacillus macerans]